jgi:hypothetical protein
MATQATPDAEKDRQEILRLHNEWWNANCGLHIDGMRRVFAGGDKFHGFNLNLHTYYGIEEWTKLWEHYQKTIDITEVPETRDMRVFVKGDVGWFTCEGTLKVKALRASGTGSSALKADESVTSFRFRGTEVYVREDAEGNPVWKMWHCHYSPCAPEGEPHPGF